jgi:phosphopantothenoylcysteine decarboxylase/phosphopantothenate--cysteine ligase
MTAQRSIFLGVGAGAATFKAVALASQLAQRGFVVRVAMTTSAQAYVGPLSFLAVTGQEVVTRIDAVDADGTAAHLKSAQAAAFVVVPATADLIAKLAHGLADDAVSLAALSAPEHRLLCPAMNDRMWRNPIVQDNVRRLESLGWKRVGPVRGRLAEGYEGEGRMSEPEAILEAVLRAVGDA